MISCHLSLMIQVLQYLCRLIERASGLYCSRNYIYDFTIVKVGSYNSIVLMIIMAISSATVVGNSLLLGRYKPRSHCLLNSNSVKMGPQGFEPWIFAV